MTLSAIKARIGAVSPTTLSKIAETSPAVYQLITVDMPILIQLVESIIAHRAANANGELTKMYRLESEIDRELESL